MQVVKSVVKLRSSDREQVLKVIDEFKGHVGTLESALGALIIGQHYGWRVLKIAHGNRTYNNYQKILGIRFEDVCPERTELSHRSVALSIADKAGSFWAVVRGKQKVPNKGIIS